LHADAELDIDRGASLNEARRIAHEAEHTLTRAVPKWSSALYTSTQRPPGPTTDLGYRSFGEAVVDSRARVTSIAAQNTRQPGPAHAS